MKFIHEFELTKEEAEAFTIVRKILVDINEDCVSNSELSDLNTIAVNALHYLNELWNDEKIYIEGEKNE